MVVVMGPVPAAAAASSVDDDHGDVVPVADAVTRAAVLGRNHHRHRLLLLPRENAVVGVEDVLQDEDDVRADKVPVFFCLF